MKYNSYILFFAQKSKIYLYKGAYLLFCSGNMRSNENQGFSVGPGKSKTFFMVLKLLLRGIPTYSRR